MPKTSRFQPGPATFHRLRASWRYCLLLICVLALASCSSTRIAYELLDWAAMRKIDRMVKLDMEQRNTAKAAVRTAHSWHRKTQLPLYADYIDGLQQRLQQGPITGEQIHAETDQVQSMLDVAMEYVLPMATDVIASLSDAQVTELLNSVAEERLEYIEEYIEPGEEELYKTNADKAKDYFKRFAGRPTAEQEAWIDAWSRQLQPYAELSAQQQLLWEEHLGKYLALRDNKPLLQQGLRELMLYRSDTWHPDLRAAVDANQTLTYELIARLINSFTPAQEKRFYQNIQGYASDFRQLAQKG